MLFSFFWTFIAFAFTCLEKIATKRKEKSWSVAQRTAYKKHITIYFKDILLFINSNILVFIYLDMCCVGDCKNFPKRGGSGQLNAPLEILNIF